MSGDFVLDGEVCMMDDNGNEDFQGIMKQIKRKAPGHKPLKTLQ